MTNIQALLLDADGVVQTTPVRWRDAVAALSPEPVHAEAFLEAVFAAERPCLTGQRDFESALSGVLEAWGSPATLSEALSVWSHIRPVEGVLSLVDELRLRGFRVGLATNQQRVRARYMLDSLGYRDRFDDFFISCELGHAKPGQDFFRTMLDRLRLDGSRVLFVDDHPENVAAARESGFNAEVYDLKTGVSGMRRLLARYGIGGAQE